MEKLKVNWRWVFWICVIILLVWLYLNDIGMIQTSTFPLDFEEMVIGLLVANLGYSFYLNSLLAEHIESNRAQKG